MAEGDVKDVLEGYTKVFLIVVLRRHHVADGVDGHVDRYVFEPDGGVRSTFDGEPREGAIVSKKRLTTSSRLVSSALQSFCRMSEDKWMRSIPAGRCWP